MKSDDLKQSDASLVGGTNGSLNGLTKSDLARGYGDAGVDEYANVETATFEQQQGGFLKRPHGWER